MAIGLGIGLGLGLPLLVGITILLMLLLVHPTLLHDPRAPSLAKESEPELHRTLGTERQPAAPTSETVADQEKKRGKWICW